ncbi:hypothetical protein GW17_00003474 [Ensete ventricosum]|nr:hypothetical protein GW17_00003474 [Ensete ventricosum]RZR92198.1 hypothetical protein BHM03_00020449 [Ensete ventricosum]
MRNIMYPSGSTTPTIIIAAPIRYRSGPGGSTSINLDLNLLLTYRIPTSSDQIHNATVVVSDLMARRAISTVTGGTARSVLGIHVFHCPVSGLQSNPLFDQLSRSSLILFWAEIGGVGEQDVVGIVAKLSECIASRGGNIRSVDVFVPENKQDFYSRSLNTSINMVQVERVSHRDTLQSFVQKSENLEKQCLAQAIKSYCELRVLPYQENKTLVF